MRWPHALRHTLRTQHVRLHILLLACLPAGVCVFSFSASTSSDTVSGKFVDITEKSGVRFLHRSSPTSRKYLPETMGAGVALFDFDNDGLLDLYLLNGAPLADPTAPGTIPKKNGPEFWNRLYRQHKDGTFEDVTERAGVAGTGYGRGMAV